MAGAGDAAWRPACDRAALELRADALRRIRAFFAERGVLEVETPVLSTAGIPDPALVSLTTGFTGPGGPRALYLQTSPEFPMKRLLAAGSGCIYQLARVFRNGEYGSLHNPEFSMLEWYRIGFDHHRLMDEVEELVRTVLRGHRDPLPAERLSVEEAFARHAGVDPIEATVADLRRCLRDHGVTEPPGMAGDEVQPWFDLVLTHLVEPHLGRGRLTFLYDYPPAQAALSRVRPDARPVGERFEAYLDGVELANGFHELGDAREQRSRFMAENAARQARGLAPVPLDEHLLEALAAGLPACAGVALGFDRLLMLARGARSLGAVMPFPFDRV